MTFDVARYEALLPEIIADFVTAELRARQPSKFESLTVEQVKASADWRSDFSLDSMDRMALGAACAEFFNVYDSGREDTLLGKANVERWSEVVTLAQRDATRNITFRSSGSTGDAKHFRHPAEWLHEEAVHWSALAHAHERTRIVTHVPLHHIYGYLWAAMLSAASGLPLIRQSASSLRQAELADGDVLITTPHLIEAWLARSVSIERDVIAVSSTGRFTKATHTLARDALRIAAVWEIYGSSETAGLGLRKSDEDSYEWLPHWEPCHTRDAQDATYITSVRRSLGGAAIEVALPDSVYVSAETPRRFHVGERNDDVVKISGHRIDLNELRALLKQMPSITDANVRSMRDGEKDALKVFLVPHATVDDETQFISDAKAWLQSQWLHASAVSRWTIGSALPRNAMGKLADW
jgi:4-coumarate--CoA ligase (photoactive yellow protein activation family)